MGAGKYMRIPNLENIPQISSTLSHEAAGATTTSNNYLDHWLFTLLLLQSMDRETGRVIVVGGMIHDARDRGNEINQAFEEELQKRIQANNSSDAVESIARGTRAASPDGPAQGPRHLYGIQWYGASKLFRVLLIPELQCRLNSVPNLNKVSILDVDTGVMPITITVGTLNWLVRFVFYIVARVASVVSPNGLLRSTQKSAGDILVAALDTTSPTGQRPKSLYLNGSALREMSSGAMDAKKRASVWRASL
ncbi:hypothetical protein HBI56_083670 [Parastagonospora nodorum]|nr:hypothetical protein HBH56_102900 [Parastagonospora nodorum]KAH3929336.1 hypothetical protein HBH54_127510 [Parastagonospora nodorum]KAH3951796.1 hypothetical protein HBH53_061530 [Parastagonospora nodorum]KAH3975281.1 hypothetical protein HBH52_125330 [Parastagonospora nodorum]KAH3978531.1 hypothetical protein HBH51_062270 [Parastagonospora nodorum]